MEWYIVYRCYRKNPKCKVILSHVIDGVYCTHEDQAVRISMERVAIGKRDWLQAERCECQADVEIAKHWDRISQACIDKLWLADWTRAEFVEFMQMPTYAGSHP